VAVPGFAKIVPVATPNVGDPVLEVTAVRQKAQPAGVVQTISIGVTQLNKELVIGAWQIVNIQIRNRSALGSVIDLALIVLEGVGIAAVRSLPFVPAGAFTRLTKPRAI
jgi:hypothetical protein